MEKKKPRAKKKTNTRIEMTEKPMKNTTDPTNDASMPDPKKEVGQNVVEVKEIPSKDAVKEKEESNVKQNEIVEIDEGVQTPEKQISSGSDTPSIARKSPPLENQIITEPKTKTEPEIFSSASATIQMLSHPNEKLRIEAIESLLRIADKVGS